MLENVKDLRPTSNHVTLVRAQIGRNGTLGDDAQPPAVVDKECGRETVLDLENARLEIRDNKEFAQFREV